MRTVVIDENLPRAFGSVFADHHFQVFDVRDHELRGEPDHAVFEFAKKHHAAVATADVYFGQIIHRLEIHHGIFLLRLPSFVSLQSRCERLGQGLAELKEFELENCIVVITMHAIRIHKK